MLKRWFGGGHAKQIGIRIFVALIFPRVAATLEQPHSGNIFQQADRAADSAFVREIQSARFFRHAQAILFPFRAATRCRS